LKYAIEGLRDGLREQIELVQEQQWSIIWRNFLFEGAFGKSPTNADKRRRRLLLDLQEKPVPISKLADISPRVRDDYRNLTSKTLERDVDKLKDMGLVEKTGDGVRARFEILRAFLARQAPVDSSPNE